MIQHNTYMCWLIRWRAASAYEARATAGAYTIYTIARAALRVLWSGAARLRRTTHIWYSVVLFPVVLGLRAPVLPVHLLLLLMMLMARHG